MDLERIWDYTHDRWGIHQAEQYLRELEHAIDRVASNPRIGRECDEIRPGYRKLAAGSHTLFYRVIADDVIDVPWPHNAPVVQEAPVPLLTRPRGVSGV